MYSRLVLKTDAEGRIIDADLPAAAFFLGEVLLGRFCGELLGIEAASLAEVFEECAASPLREIVLTREDARFVFEVMALPLNVSEPATGGSLIVLREPPPGNAAPGRERDPFRSDKMRSAVFQSVGEGILVVDEEREIVNANQQACEIFGLSPQNLVGTDIMSLTDEAGGSILRNCIDRMIEGQRLSTELTGVYVDGRTFPTRTTVTRIDYEGHRFWNIVVLDTTEEKALENSLREEKRQTEAMNMTLKNVLRSIESDRRDYEYKISSRIKTAILPMIDKLRKEAQPAVRNSFLSLLGDQLIALTSGFETELDAGLLKLSRTEIEVCRLIQGGFSSKEIGDIMNLAFETVQTQRKNIRKKLNLNGKKLNLHAYLATRVCEDTHRQDARKRCAPLGMDTDEV